MTQLVMNNKNKTNLILQILITAIISVLIMAVVLNANVNKTKGDSLASLLLSQTIIDSGTIKLDQYKDIKSYVYVVRKQKNHYYNYFPLGSSLSSIPFVYLAHKVYGMDMHNKNQESSVQRRIAAITAAMCFLIMFFIARIFLEFKTSVFISAIFWFGTSFASTMGTALWSHNFASVYCLLSIYLVIKIYHLEKSKLWMLLPFFLFLAYLSRPTLSLLSITIIGFLFFHNKFIGIKVIILLAVLLMIFMGFSYYEFGQILPDYYMPKRLDGDNFWQAIYANLLSPARGLLIFSPFIFVLLVNYKAMKLSFNNHKFLYFLLAWVFVHLIVISRFPTWWAGYSFGPRFMADILPALFLSAVLFINYGGLKPVIIKALLFVTIPLAVYINSYQALYNEYTEKWNGWPDIDKYNHYIFDWKYPQFLHNESQFINRIIDHFDTNVRDLYGMKINFASHDVYYKGWSFAAAHQRWSLDESSEIFYNFTHNNNLQGILELQVRTLGKQTISVSINDNSIGKKTINSTNTVLSFDFEPDILIENKINTISFEFSDPHIPNTRDSRRLALALKWFIIK